MATYDLKYPGAAIDAILDTAYHLQQAGYIFRGSASDYSGTPTEREWVIAPAGSTGFGLSSAVPQGSFGICLYNGTAWVGKVINVLTLDSQPTRNSQNGVTSGGVAATLDEIAGGIMDTFASLLFDDETASADLRTKLSYAVKFSVSDVYQTVTHLNILAATTSKAGLMSAEDKAKVDSFLTNLRSLTFADTTASADQATQITETLKATIGGVQEVIDSITILAATSSKAGLLSASDKAYIDALPATLTSLSNSISGALALMQSMMGYYVCDTAAGTAAKTVDATGYSLTNGGCIRIKMTNANTANNVTLNINSTGAKALYYDGSQASASNTWEAGEVLEVYYDGTQYQCASGGGGKFATGEKVKEVSITDNVSHNSDALPTSNAVYSSQRNFPITSITSSDSDFDITDEEGYAIVTFANGHVKTKKFNSEMSVSGGYDSSDSDLSIDDFHGNVLVEFRNGHIRTKNFDSALQGSSIASDNIDQVVIGELTQGMMNGYEVAPSVSSLVSDTIAIPYEEAEIFISIKPMYNVLVKIGYLNGDNGVNFNTTLGTFLNNQSFKLPPSTVGNANNTLSYIRFQVAKVSGDTIDASEDIGFKVSFKPKDNIIDTNSDILDEIQAKSSLVNNRGCYPVIVHGSDIHGDVVRLANIYKVAENIQADAIVLTGDIVTHHPSDNIKSLIEMAKSHSIPTLICAGNHEVGFAYSNINYSIDDEDVYAMFFDELATHFSYISSGSTISDVPYYFKDIPSKNIRLIGLYQYVEGAPDGAINALRWDLHYNQAEMDWFCNTLLSTPENYCILLLMHTPELSQNGGKIQDNDLFYANHNYPNVRSTVTNGQPILEICDAFISRGTLQKTYTQTGTPSSFTVDADFSSVPASVDFVAQMNGHYHMDAVGLVSGATERQVMLNIACTAGTYVQSKVGDTVRNVRNSTGNSFNVYVINKASGKIDIYKIGSHRTVDDRNRVHMQIMYK